ncbi:MAG: ABC transporter permease [Clostridia bacterium]|nr:ABC transporter permease [Clostridia bacterium]
MISLDFVLKFIVAAVAAGTPLLFGTVGEILSEKVGHLNLGVEGMMSIGALTGFMAGYASHNLALSMIAAFLGGMVSALIYAVLTIGFMANQNVIGLTLTIFGVGFANFVGVYMVGKTTSNTWQLSSDLIAQMKSIHIPLLSDVPVVGKLIFSYDPFTYTGIVIALICGWYLFKTKAGLNTQAIGENPAAADAASIGVTKWKFINILIGGGICGIGGAYCSMIINGGVWISDCVGGLGWISVALVIFAAWRPQTAILGSFIFGALRVLKYYVPSVIPIAFFNMLPFIITAAVLLIASIRGDKGSHIPENLGFNYFREDR